MASIDPARRRLTVAPGAAAALGEAAKGTVSESDPGPIIDKAKADGKLAVYWSSQTDSNGSRRKSFGAKDVDFRSSVDAPIAKEWLDSFGLAVSCNKGMKPEAPNQDSFAVLGVEGEFLILGVFDGHGPNGHDVSEYVRKNLPADIAKEPNLLKDTENVLTTKFLECQQKLEANKAIDSQRSGTTCTVAVWNFSEGTVTVAHVADSRSVLGWQSKPAESYQTEDITEDHKPNLPKEKARIESMGGRVVFDGFFNHRVFAKNGHYPGLNMSRALGDVVAHKEAGLTAQPDVRVVKIADYAGRVGKDGSLKLILASDGVWEFLESNAVFQAIGKVEGGPQKQMEHLAKLSYDAWMADSDGEISDDITAMIITLPVM